MLTMDVATAAPLIQGFNAARTMQETHFVYPQGDRWLMSASEDNFDIAGQENDNQKGVALVPYDRYFDR